MLGHRTVGARQGDVYAIFHQSKMNKNEASRSARASTGKGWARRAIPALVSLAILAVLWWQIDLGQITRAARGANPAWLAAGLATVIPLTLGTAYRFRLLSRTSIPVPLAVRLILAASTLNLLLPSKMGDIAKAWVLERRHGFQRGQAVSLVVFEKLLDLGALLILGVAALAWMRPDDVRFILGAVAVALGAVAVGIVLSPLSSRIPVPRRIAGMTGSWSTLVTWFWADRARATGTVALSLAIWAGHLIQFWFFALAFGTVPVIGSMAAATLSVLAGLLPFTMAGVGTRDAAIVLFYSPWLDPGACAMLGILATLRYVLPALAGLPFMSDYWQSPKEPADR